MCKKFEDFEKEALQYKQILLDYRDKGKVFCDSNFHPDSKIPESKVKIDSEIKWNRIDSIYPASLFNPDLINPRFIQNGENANLSFISVLLHLSSQPYLIPYLFDRQAASILGKVKNSINLKCGAVVVYFHAFGRKTPVLIDTRIPCGSDGTPLFTKLNDSTKSPWFILVEKAFAKLCESYSGIHSNNFTSSMYFLYGYYGAGVHHSFDLKKNKRSPFENILHFKQKKAFIEVSATTFKMSKDKPNVTTNGLSKDHSYSVIELKQYEDKNFFLLRNPEGIQSWNGDWSQESPLWTPEMKKDFDLENLTPGTFWMIESDFFKNFGNFEIVKPIKRKWHKRHILYQIPTDPKGAIDQFGFQVAEYTPDEKVPFHIIGERRHQLVDEKGNLNPEPPNWTFSSISFFSVPFNVICATPRLTKVENKTIKITHTGKYSLIDEVFVSIYCKCEFILYNQKLPDELIPEDEKDDDKFLYFGEIIDDFLSGKLKQDLDDDDNNNDKDSTNAVASSNIKSTNNATSSLNNEVNVKPFFNDNNDAEVKTTSKNSKNDSKKPSSKCCAIC